MTGTRKPAARRQGDLVVAASPADIPALAAVIAEAFFDLQPSRWLVPDRAERRRIWPGYFRIYLQHAVTEGVVHTTPGRDAAALWIPVSDTPTEPPAGHAAALARVTGPYLDRFTAFDAALDQAHPAGFAHHYLAILAVRSDRQGQGTGTALLEAYHRHLDTQVRQPAYLEASSERTRRVYLHRGYGDFGPPIVLPGGPSMFPMLRQPRSAALAAAARRAEGPWPV
ncbi:MAG: GNAT family N-acetyltransferase, partial [Streptosporangiaceae bacterium]